MDNSNEHVKDAGPEAKPHAGLPVSGYKPQSEKNVSRVNWNKDAEERTLRDLDALKSDTDIDQRWLAIARTGFEQAYMAYNRAIFKPGRVVLPGNPPTKA